MNSWDSTFLLGFYFKSNHFQVGTVLCSEDNDKVSGGKFRHFFLTFLKMLIRNSENAKSVHLAMLPKVSPEIKTLGLWPGSFFSFNCCWKVILVLIHIQNIFDQLLYTGPRHINLNKMVFLSSKDSPSSGRDSIDISVWQMQLPDTRGAVGTEPGKPGRFPEEVI